MYKCKYHHNRRHSRHEGVVGGKSTLANRTAVMDFFPVWRDDVIRSDRGWQSGGGDPVEMILMINSNQSFFCVWSFP